MYMIDVSEFASSNGGGTDSSQSCLAVWSSQCPTACHQEMPSVSYIVTSSWRQTQVSCFSLCIWRC